MPGPDAHVQIQAERRLGGRYRLRQPIAVGGMAEVWEGYDETLSRPVAVKVLKTHLAADDSFRERFRREAITAARLVHPNVVATFDTGLDAGTAYIVMELVRGWTLRELLSERGPLPPALAVVITDQIADALGYAHRSGLIHRDVKPANVLLCDDDASMPRVKVADFGIAKATEQLDLDLTQTGMLIGTPKYLSPEQVDGREPDARADLYALGVVLFEMLAGRPPFTAQTDLAVALAHLQEPPPLVGSLRPGISPALEDLVGRLLAKDPALRVASAAELRERLAAPGLTRMAPAGGPTGNGSLQPTVIAGAVGAPPARPTGRAPTTLDPPTTRGTPTSARTPMPWSTPTSARTTTAPEGPPVGAPTRSGASYRGPAGAAADRSARLRRRRRRAPGIVVGVLVLAGAITAAVLLSTDRPARQTPPGPAAATPGQPATIDNVSVYMVNSRPPDNPGDAHYVVSGNGSLTQSWRTDVYNNAHFGNLYPGIGLALHLSASQRLTHLSVHSPSQGWSAQTYVSSSKPANGSPVSSWGTPTDTKTGIAGNTSFSLGDHSGSWVLLWLTSTGGPPFQAVISKVAVS